MRRRILIISSAITNYVTTRLSPIPFLYIVLACTYYTAVRLLTGHFVSGSRAEGEGSVVWIWLVGVWTIGFVFDMVSNYYKHRKQQIKQYRTHPHCYKLVCNSFGILALCFTLLTQEMLLSWPVVLMYIKAPPFTVVPSVPSLLMTLPLLIAHVLLILIAAPLAFTSRVMAHIRITGTKIWITSVDNPNLSEIRWSNLAGIDIQRNPSGIRKIVLQGPKVNIAIPGSHPDIQRILQDIREHAPNTVAKTFLGQRYE